MYRHAHRYLLAAFLLVLAGFFTTYFTRLLQTDRLHHLHAVIAIGWLVLLAAQSYAITHGRVTWHRAMAKLSFVLVPLVIVTGLIMVHAMLDRRPFKMGDMSTLRAFADVVGLLYFAMQYAMGIVYRRDVGQHQRFMLATVFALLPPALGRVIRLDLGLTLGHWNLTLNHGIGALVVLCLLIHDWRAERKIYFAYGLAFTFFAVLLVTQPFLRSDPDWYRFCLWLSGGSA